MLNPKNIEESTVYFFALLLRIILLIYGEWQDMHMEVKFTDVDYFVFSDAAEFVIEGESPYRRATYRYSPILAWLLTPNVLFCKAWGKLIFILFDFFTAFLIEKTLKMMSCNHNLILISLTLWLFNPIAMTVSCRGNAESLLSALVIGVIYALMKRKTVLAGVIFAIAVHMKIYPIIYSLAIFLFLGGNFDNSKGMIEFPKNFKDTRAFNFRNVAEKLFTKQRLMFFLSSIVTFSLLFCIMYALYGYDFILHTYKYHILRRDVKHNFSVYFYMLYLNANSMLSFLCFFNQCVILFVISLMFYEDLPFCFFLLTQTFVTFNKICTSQYFLWYVSLLPLLVPGFAHLHFKAVLKPLLLWFSGQGLWLFFAYLLEFQGINSFLYIWLAGICFYIINVWVTKWSINFYKTHNIFTYAGMLHKYVKSE